MNCARHGGWLAISAVWVCGLPELQGDPAGDPLAGEPASPRPFFSEYFPDTFSIYIYLQRALPLKCHCRCRVHSLIATSKMERWMGLGL